MRDGEVRPGPVEEFDRGIGGLVLQWLGAGQSGDAVGDQVEVGVADLPLIRPPGCQRLGIGRPISIMWSG